MPLLTFLTKEEREARNLRLQFEQERLKAQKFENDSRWEQIGQQLGTLFNNTTQQVEKEKLKMQDQLLHLMRKKANPKIIQYAVSSYNDKVYQYWQPLYSRIEELKNVAKKQQNQDALQMLQQLQQNLPTDFFNVDITPEGKMIVQRIDPSGTVESTQKFDTPEEYAAFIQSNPEILATEKAVEPASVYTAQREAELTGRSPTDIMQENRWLEFERLKPSQQRMIEYLANLWGVSPKEAWDRYMNMKVNLSMTSMEKNKQVINKQAEETVRLYNKYAPKPIELDSDVGPWASLIQIDPFQIKDPIKRKQVLAKMQRAIVMYLKAENPKGYEVAVKEMQKIYPLLSQIRRVVPMFEAKRGMAPNVFKKLLYSTIGKFISIDQVPGLNKLINSNDVRLIKEGQYVFNVLLKAFSGAAVSAQEAERMTNALYKLTESDPNIVVGLMNLAQEVQAQLDSAHTALGEIPYSVMFKNADYQLQQVTEMMQNILKKKGYDIADLVSVHSGSTSYKSIKSHKKPVSGIRRVVQESKLHKREKSSYKGLLNGNSASAL